MNINSVVADTYLDVNGLCNVYGVGSTGSFTTANVPVNSNIYQTGSNFISGSLSTSAPVAYYFPGTSQATTGAASTAYITQFKSSGTFGWAAYVSSN